jgi:hypothetical protein
LNTRSVNNAVNAEYEHNLNFATTFSVGGTSELLRYPDGNGLDTDSQSANAGFTRRLNARNSLSGQYTFGYFGYPGNNPTQPISGLKTSTALVGFQREWNRRITTNVSVGPEWINSSNSAVLPSSTTVAANASANGHFRFGSASLSYSRATSGGGGLLVGGEVDTVSAGFAREFVRKLSVNLTGGYMRTSGLANQRRQVWSGDGHPSVKPVFHSICELHRDRPVNTIFCFRQRPERPLASGQLRHRIFA